jgi:hypothetical protein
LIDRKLSEDKLGGLFVELPVVESPEEGRSVELLEESSGDIHPLPIDITIENLIKCLLSIACI